MNSPLLGLRTTIYRVSDIDQAKAWYSEVFGIEPYFDEPFYVGFNVGGYELGLQPDAKSDSKTDGVITYWGVENVEEIYKKVIDNGATSFEEPTEVGGGIIVSAVKDLWGNVIGFIYNPHFSLAG
ncbi:VOC family protein [Emticicia sp. C21]|uniref:VOC family protein n=1 Tax=Emticicia sp. C21 TaxID=2302915 RepID=UPI000E35271F|nr:VOC family protein [Emticicia sp. C21]RFS18044.1 VOC family protein [Emticicia sp. C21]